MFVDHIPGEKKNIFGCTEPCFEDKCNGVPVAEMAEKYRPNVKDYIDTAQETDRENKIQFPTVFSEKEIKRLRVAPVGSGSQRKWMALTSLAGPMAAVLFIVI